MKIAYVSEYDSTLMAGAWSGTGYWMARALEEAGASVSRIFPLTRPPVPFQAFQKWLSHKSGKTFVPAVEPAVAASLAAQVRARVSGFGFDAIVSPGYFPVAGLEIDIPIVVWGDATFHLLHGYHPPYQRVSRRSARNWDRVERQAQERASLLLYSSEWARRSSREYYGTPDSKSQVIPFGANVEWRPASSATCKTLPTAGKALRLLMVGVNWHRKGADIACAAVEILRARGMEVELDIVGCEPPADTMIPAYIRVHGFLSKSSAKDLSRMVSLHEEAHLLVHPSRAEPFGIVMCEAFAFATPVVAHDTGGISEIVADGITGQLLPLNTGECLAEAIEAATIDAGRYAMLSRNAREDYEKRLNWGVAGQRAVQLIGQVISQT